MKTPEQVIDYIKKSNFYLAFKLAYEEQRGVSIESLFKTILDGYTYLPEIINDSLSWRCTIEGSDFWAVINDKFKNWVLSDDLSKVKYKVDSKLIDDFLANLNSKT